MDGKTREKVDGIANGVASFLAVHCSENGGLCGRGSQILPVAQEEGENMQKPITPTQKIRPGVQFLGRLLPTPKGRGPYFGS